MNKVRRKNLQAIIDRLEELKSSLEDLQAEEEEYRDNMPWTIWKKSSAASKLLSSERRKVL